jgi:ABC-type oligopeptide transport system substrate-binding subunit
MHSTPLLRTVYLGLNWRDAPFTNQGLRQAFALAIDKQTIATQRLRGEVIPTNHIVPEGMFGYNPALVGPDSSQKLSGATGESVNLAQAFASSACGGSYAHCPPIALEVPAEDANASDVAADIARMWQAVAPGYPLTIRVEPEALLKQREANGAAQFYLDEWVANYPDAQNALDRFAANAPGVSGSVNLPDANALLTTAEAEQDPTQRAKDYQAAEQLLVSAVAVIPIYQKEFFWQTSAQAQNIVFDPQGQMSVYDTLPSVVIMANG